MTYSNAISITYSLLWGRGGWVGRALPWARIDIGVGCRSLADTLGTTDIKISKESKDLKIDMISMSGMIYENDAGGGLGGSWCGCPSGSGCRLGGRS